jgi:hypothetical protein
MEPVVKGQETSTRLLMSLTLFNVPIHLTDPF